MTEAGQLVTGFPRPVGGRLSLDFVNSVDPRHGPARRELFGTYDAVLDLAGSIHALPLSALHVLRARAADEPDLARQALGRIVLLRDALYRMLAAATAGLPVAEADLARVNRSLQTATAAHLLVARPNGGVIDGWAWRGDLDELTWPVVVDAWDVLTGPSLARVKECPGDDGTCGWLFEDRSRNGIRRWCDMRTCGNRAKARTHHGRGTGHPGGSPQS